MPYFHTQFTSRSTSGFFSVLHSLNNNPILLNTEYQSNFRIQPKNLGRKEKSHREASPEIGEHSARAPKNQDHNPLPAKKKRNRGTTRKPKPKGKGNKRKKRENSWRREIPRWSAAPMAKAQQMQIYRGEKEDNHDGKEYRNSGDGESVTWRQSNTQRSMDDMRYVRLRRSPRPRQETRGWAKGLMQRHWTNDRWRD